MFNLKSTSGGILAIGDPMITTTARCHHREPIGLEDLNGWTSPQMLTLYGASARSARARRTYDRIMEDTT